MSSSESGATPGGLPALVRLAAVASFVVGVLAMMLGGTAAFGAARGTAFAPCLAVGTGSQVHFLLGNQAAPLPLASTGATVTGLDPGTCDGQPVTITLTGNTAGDPSQPANEALAVWDSTLDPCSGAVLARPLVVAAGSITLHACPTVTDPTHAAYVDVHDLTLLRVQVSGADINVGPTTSVLGETFTKSGSPTAGVSPVTGRDLPFTGTWAALTFWLGLLLVVVGAVVLYLGRRRGDEDPASPSVP